MSEKTPERIWIYERANYLLHEEGSCLCYSEIRPSSVEYVRADLLATVRKEEREAAFRDVLAAADEHLNKLKRMALEATAKAVPDLNPKGSQK